MDEGGSPALEVGFEINFGDAFAELLRFNDVIDDATAHAIKEFTAIERASKGALDLSGATAQFKTFSNAATRAEQDIRKEKNATEAAGERMIRQLERQTSEMGKTRDEIRDAKVEALALAAAQQKNTDLADRLLTASRERRFAAEAVAEAEMRAAAAAEAATFGDRADRLRASIDPAAAAQQRFNREMAEARTLIAGGAISLDEYVAKLQLERAALTSAESGIRTVGSTGKLTGFHMQNLAFQFQDLGVQMASAAGSSAPLKMAFMALFQQGTQISGIMSQAGVGVGGLARAVGTMIAPFTGAIAVAGLLGAALLGVKQAAASDAEMQKFASGLGLTKKEMEKLKDVSVTWGDTMSATFEVLAEYAGFTATGIKDWFADAFTSIGEFGKFSVQIVLAAFASAVKGIYSLFANLPGIIGNAAVGAANFAIEAFERMLNFGIAALNKLGGLVNSIFKTSIAPVAEVSLGRIETKFKGSFGNVGKDTHDQFMKTFRDIEGGFDKISTRATKKAQDRLSKQAADMIADRTPKKPKKEREDHSGESLARELAATEALIKGNYALAEAYQVSDVAAFQAEVRAKATAEAIKKKADVESYVAQQMRLAVSQRAVDGGKAIATLAAQTAAQRQVNDAVSAGTMTSEAAQAAISHEAQLRPLTVAQAAAEGEAKDALAKIIGRLRAEQAAANVETARAKVLADTAAASDQLDKLRLEVGLINASNRERAVALAQLEVEQYLRANPGVPADEAARYRETKLAVAGMSAELATARSDADLLLASMQAIADQASVTAGIMSSAFGNVGDVVGGILGNFADYRVQQAQLAKEVAAKTKSQAEADKVLATLQTKNTAAAISGVKSLFKEKSTAFKVMSAIEKAYAVWQAAETIASIVRDTTKTTSAVANSAVRTTANTAEGGSKIFAELGPFGFPVVAAMVAVLAALGASALGGGGGSGPSNIPSAEDLQAGQGAGTVLGDSKAKSESIARSLDIVASNTNRDLEYSNGMLTALRSIDFGISKMAGTIARQISVTDSMFDTSKLRLGSSASGGFLGLTGKGLDRQLYDLGLQVNSGSLSDMIANGVSGLTYQVVQETKTKKGLFGSKTKTDLDTYRSSLPADIAQSFSDVLASLRDGVLAAADVVGLEGAQAILASFQVSIGKISFKDMTGEQIEQTLNNIFSKVGDEMSGAVLPALAEMQKVGEGLFETFMRVAREYEVVDVALESIGKTFGAVGVNSIAARDALVQLFGTVDDFAEATANFRDQFLTEAEQIAPIAASVRAEMARLGLAGVATRDQFKQAVLGLDLTTAAGREMYASLLAVAPAFDKVLDYFDQANKATADGLKATADQFNGFVASLTKYRDSLFAADVSTTDAYRVLRARFDATATLAASGDATALGGLEAAGKAFLDAARNNAATREDYLRDVGIVARGVDAGIFAADAKADYAQLQLDALNNAVSILGTINTNTAATAGALGGTNLSSSNETLADQLAAQASAADSVSSAGVGFAASAPSNDSQSAEALRLAVVEMGEQLAQLREDNNAGHAATASYTSRMARKLDDVTAASGGDAISMVAPA